MRSLGWVCGKGRGVRSEECAGGRYDRWGGGWETVIWPLVKCFTAGQPRTPSTVSGERNVEVGRWKCVLKKGGGATVVAQGWAEDLFHRPRAAVAWRRFGARTPLCIDDWHRAVFLHPVGRASSDLVSEGDGEDSKGAVECCGSRLRNVVTPELFSTREHM